MRVRSRDQIYLIYFTVAKLSKCDNQEHMILKTKWVRSFFKQFLIKTTNIKGKNVFLFPHKVWGTYFKSGCRCPSSFEQRDEPVIPLIFGSILLWISDLLILGLSLKLRNWGNFVLIASTTCCNSCKHIVATTPSSTTMSRSIRKAPMKLMIIMVKILMKC